MKSALKVVSNICPSVLPDMFGGEKTSPSQIYPIHVTGESSTVAALKPRTPCYINVLTLLSKISSWSP